MRRSTVVLTCVLTLVPGVARAGNVTNDPLLSYVDPMGVGTTLKLQNIGKGVARFEEAGIEDSDDAADECVDGGNFVDCPAYDQTAYIGLAGGGDTFSSNVNEATISVNGGPGNDAIGTGDGDDLIGGGTGSDNTAGNGGDDLFRDSIGLLTPQPANGDDMFAGGGGDDRMDMGADGSPDAAGADTFDGGTGTDLADYGLRTAPLTITVGAGADDGAAGEGDSVVAADVVRTGAGNDVVTLAPGAAGRIEGGAGNDRLTGSGAADVLLGSGPDLAAGSGDDVLDGRGGADDLRGGDGVDTVDYGSRTAAVRVSTDGVADDGEAGENDLVQGDIESVIGGAGDDVLVMRDGRAGTISCGAGTDSVVADEADVVAADCETVSRPLVAPGVTPSPTPTPGAGGGTGAGGGGTGAGTGGGTGTGGGSGAPGGTAAIVPQLTLRAGTLRLTKGRVLVSAACPKGASGACAGTLSITTVKRGRTPARSLGRLVVALAPGTSRRYAFRPSRALARTLRRAGRSSVTVRFVTVSPGARTVVSRRRLSA